MRPNDALLEADEPEPYIVRPGGGSPFVLTCDHAGTRIPKRLGDLGVSDADRQRHIAWDIGALGVAVRLADALDAYLAAQPYSRLVIDCNRSPGAPSSIPHTSEATAIPGNVGLSEAEKDVRRASLFEPYHAQIVAELSRREAAGQPTVLVTVHSFTPVFHGVARPWHAGILYDQDERFARPLLELLATEPDLVVGDNQPYSGRDGTDYGIIVYGEARGLPYAELEIRQDLIADAVGQAHWASVFARLLPRALAQMQQMPPSNRKA